MGSNQPYDPYEEQKKREQKQAAIDREASHRRTMEFYDAVGNRQQDVPFVSPVVPDPPKPQNPGLTTVVPQAKKDGAGTYVVIGCIIAAIIAHLNYGVNSGGQYAAVVGVTALLIWIAYALDQTPPLARAAMQVPPTIISK